jgi:aspartyl-tRNA(Asn)/glutamyl-tRNA(Gln) amidotransferase subunit B
MAKFNYEPTIGLEIHVQLKTKSKMFCGCDNFSVDAPPNTNIDPVCMGMPGTLPVPNKQAIEWAVLAALALSCTINRETKFDRKHYFYPDLPKGYQISQYDKPIGENGSFVFDVDGEERTVRIKRVHLEEDAGKLVHPLGLDYSLVDFNRAGTPLLEIVTEPDIKSPKEARIFMQELRKLMRYLRISDANMEQGNLRADANVSVHLRGSKKLGAKVEIKNMNSFKFLEEALSSEIERQTKNLIAGVKIEQETRGYVEQTGETVPQRTKEEAMDYRYFPEPDVPPIRFVDFEPGVTQNLVGDTSAPSGRYGSINLAEIRMMLPELPRQKKKRFMEDWKLLLWDAETLTNDRDLADYYEKVVSVVGPKKAQKAANWVLTVLLEQLNKHFVAVADSPVPPENLAKLIGLVEQGKLNNRLAKEVFVEMFERKIDPEKVIEQKGLGQISDEEKLKQIIAKVIQDNPQQVKDYKSGNEKIFGFLIGQVMKETQGRANPEIVNRLLKSELV